MPSESQQDPEDKFKIVIRKDGPYMVEGKIPLVHKTQVVSEFGEPLTWKKEETFETRENYDLCRCGQSQDKPFCDATHALIEFDGTEVAAGGEEHPAAIRTGTGIVVKRDHDICIGSGFCGNRKSNIPRMIPQTADTVIRAQVMAMIDRCPSGSYTYSLEAGGPDIEPDLPRQIAVTTEITSGGPISGPLWVTGNIPIELSDGQPLQPRNRVTLCGCGASRNKPLCDGTHRERNSKEA